MPQVRLHGRTAVLSNSPSGSAASSGDEADRQAGACRFASTIFESYAAACRAAADSEEDEFYEQGLQRVSEHLLSSQSDAACLICLENIRHADPTWHCSEGCFEVVHLSCIQAWARQQLAAVQAKAEQSLALQPFAAAAATAAEARRAATWGCPKCRTQYGAAAVPTEYRCFCGKAADPPFDPWNAPHTCGERCERLSPACGHACVLLCHPGPCPPCPQVVDTTCFCGRLSMSKRCGRHEFSCGSMCGATLPCGHTCKEICHDGECPPCSLTSIVSCLCGAEAAQLPCSQSGVFQCTRVCSKQLSCGRHRCSRVCHAGACGECDLAGLKTCPCGKVAVPDAACDVPVPPCGSTCDKLLPCGVHRCNERCHMGACTATCRELVEKACRCGKTTRRVQCHEDFRCERRCGQALACGKHQCKRRCCDGNCPPCEEVCGKWLKCKNHRCQAPCHQGHCAPCPLTARISCACGATCYSVPCGRESTALPPPCSRPCPVPALCRHAGQLAQHRCHYGPCPGRPHALCAKPCGSQLPCGHACAATGCHDPLPPPVPAYQPPPPPVAPMYAAGAAAAAQQPTSRSSAKRAQKGRQPQAHPGDRQPPAVQAQAEAAALLETLPRTASGHLTPCPPCTIPVPVRCLGGHVTVQQPCFSAAPYACEARCGQALACGNHACAMRCHDAAAVPCKPCRLSCQRPLPECKHPCPLPCHPPGQDCLPCMEPVTRPCFCGKTTLAFCCHEVSGQGLPPERLRCTKPCNRRLPLCPHFCTDSCHDGPCPAGTPGGCGQEVSVRCKCKRSMKRKLPCSEVQALLAASFGSGAYDGATSLRLLPCDAECSKAAEREATVRSSKQDTAQDKDRKGASMQAKAPKAEGPAASAAAAAAAPTVPRDKRAAREERERQRAEAARQKEAAARSQQLRQRVLLAVVAVVGMLMALLLYRLLLASALLADAVLKTEL